jgi:hypothetical membrane protein
MKNDRSPLVIFAAIVFLVLGIVSLISSYRNFGGNFYFNAGLIVLGVLILLSALLSKVKGSMGLILAGLWLVAMGLMNIYHVSFVYDQLFMAFVPIAAAILMLFGI